MKTLITGMVIGAASLWIYGLVTSARTVNRLGQFLYLSGIMSLVFGIQTFTGSMIEHEIQAGWMGLGAFGFTTAILFIMGWRYGSSEKQDSERKRA